MPRTTDELVEGIIEVDSTIDLTPFIAVANSLVTRHCASKLTDAGAAYYDSTELELIERWLAAHCYATRDGRAVSESAGPVSESKQSSVAIGFDNSHYGQMAMRLDPAGGLAALNQQMKKGGRVRVGMTWAGTNPEPERRSWDTDT